MEENGIWKSKREVRWFMLDRSGEINLRCLCELIEETAGEHCIQHHIGFRTMKSKNLLWVINRIKIEINRYPKWEEWLQIETWVNTMKGPFSHRYFSVKNEAGEELVAASSLWFLVDAENHRPARLAFEHTMPTRPDKETSCGQSTKIRVAGETDTGFRHRVQNSNIDWLGHVNNVCYITWLTDCLKAKPQKFEINFLAELKEGDEIKILKTETNSKNYSCSIVRISDEKEMARATIGL